MRLENDDEFDLRVPPEVEVFCVSAEAAIPSGWQVVVVKRARCVQILNSRGQAHDTMSFEAIVDGHYKNGYAVPLGP